MISYKQHPPTAQGTPACPEKWFPAPSASDRRPEEHYRKQSLALTLPAVKFTASHMLYQPTKKAIAKS